MRKGWICVLTVCLLMLLAQPSMAADVPYLSYEQTEEYAELPAPNAYRPTGTMNGVSLGGEEWNAPEDMVFDKDGNFYLLDTGANCIYVYDRSFKPVRTIRELTAADGTQDGGMNNPRSLFVADNGWIYVADTNNERVIKMTGEGKILREYRRPESETYTSDVYYPTKVVVDKENTVYIISQNVYQGVILYADEGEFKGYFGSPPVKATMQLLIDRFWKSILSKKIREGLSDYVPVEYTSLDIDGEGFVYAVSSYTDGNEEQIRRLNYYGTNILSNTGNLGEAETFTSNGESWYSKFSDVCATEENIYALDVHYQRVYVFDMQGNRLMTFGTTGEQQGAFRRCSAVEYRDGKVYVLDTLKRNVTVFAVTPYGQSILTASHYSNLGEYDEAMGHWEKVLAANANSEAAYLGIGEAKLKNEDYAGAVKYFRLADNPERESVAFGYWRTQWMQKYMGIGIVLFVLLLIALVAVTNRRFLAMVEKRWAAREHKDNIFKLVWRVMTRPVENFNELKHKRYQNVGLILAVLLIWVIVNILINQFTGFRFNTSDPQSFSLPVQVLATVLPFVVVAGMNWCVCSISDGEGKFGEIATYLAIAVIPYIAFSAVGLVLSQFLLLSEQVFITTLTGIGLLWTVVLVFHGQRTVHNYTTGKTICMALMTAVGVLAVVILLLLTVTLVLQMFGFFTTVYGELSFRK